MLPSGTRECYVFPAGAVRYHVVQGRATWFRAVPLATIWHKRTIPCNDSSADVIYILKCPCIQPGKLFVEAVSEVLAEPRDGTHNGYGCNGLHARAQCGDISECVNNIHPSPILHTKYDIHIHFDARRSCVLFIRLLLKCCLLNDYGILIDVQVMRSLQCLTRES